MIYNEMKYMYSMAAEYNFFKHIKRKGDQWMKLLWGN